MTTPSRSTSTSTALAWVLNLARMLASSLNVPEPLVHNTGVFVYARVQAAEHRAAKTLCPVRLKRLLKALFR
jgi:serine/threonine-protein kinase RIO1